VFHNNWFDVVYHLAAIYGRHRGEDRYKNLWEVNAIGTKNMIMLQEKIKFKMIYFSSSEALGEGGRLYNDYAMSKYVGEHMVRNSMERKGTETIIIRPSGLYGKEEYSQYRGLIPTLIYKCLKEEEFTLYKNHKRTWLYIDDAIKAFANAANEEVCIDTYNVTGDEESENWEVFTNIAGCLPQANALVEMKETEPLTVGIKKLDNDTAKSRLGLEQTVNLKQGLVLTINWMKERYETKIKS